MSENKTLECSSDETTNEWKVGPGAWISLVIVLLVFSGLLFKVEGMAWLGAFDFTTLGGAFGTMKTPETNTFIGSGGISAKAGFLFALSLVPTVMLALGLLALTVRALLGRRRLKQAAARYQDPDCRMGCGYILCAVHNLLGQPGLPEDPLSPEDAEDLVYLEQEVWYSGHTMTEDQRRRCLALLESARRVWREQTPALRRFAARFITCKVF